VYSSTSASSDNYEFRFSFSSAASPDANAEFIISNNRLANIGPTILPANSNGLPETINISLGLQDVYNFNGENGTISNEAGAKQVGLEWSIQGDPNNDFAIDSNGLLSTTSETVAGTFNLTIKLSDAGSPSATHNVKIISDLVRDDDGNPIYTPLNEDSWCLMKKGRVSGMFGDTVAQELGSPVTISAAQQSVGYFWTSNPSNSQNNEPFDRTAGSNSLQLPGTISSDGDDKRVVMPKECAYNSAQTLERVWSNINLTSKSKIYYPTLGVVDWPVEGVAITTQNDIVINNPNPAAFQNTNVSSGSMFIQVYFDSNGKTLSYKDYLNNEENIICEKGFSGDSIAKVGIPAVLQYRENPEDEWQTAIDIEGNECLFESEQQASVKPRLVFGDTYNNTGVILNNSKSTIDVGEPNSTLVSNNNVAQINFQLWKANDGRDAFTNPDREKTYEERVSHLTVGSVGPYFETVKTFVVGKDQSYLLQPDRFGDYRLLVRYPHGTFPAAVSTSGCPNNGPGLVVAKNTTDCIDTIKNPVFKQFRGFKTSLTYGDFYNPVGVGKACMNNLGYDDLENPISYPYKISAIDRDNQVDASYDEPVTEVYAREWHCKYITKFFTDKQCSIPYSFNGYRAYSPLSEEKIVVGSISYTGITGAGTVDAYFGFNRSDNSHSQGVGEELITSPRDNEDNRRWTAKFLGGQKFPGTALANEFKSLDQSRNVRKITWSGGKDLEINQTVSNSQTLITKTIQGTLTVTEGQATTPAIIGLWAQKGSLAKFAPVTYYVGSNAYQTTEEVRPEIGEAMTSITTLEIDGIGELKIKIGKTPVSVNDDKAATCSVQFPTIKRSDGEGGEPGSPATIRYCTYALNQPDQENIFFAQFYVNNVEKPEDPNNVYSSLKNDPALLQVPPGEYSYVLTQEIQRPADATKILVLGGSGVFEK
jgi:hypothetical protein